MKALYEDGTIDESLYDLWLEKLFTDIENKEKADK
jgi:hypothetical protein